MDNCFAKGPRSCKILTDLVCFRTGKCPFYKSKEEHRKDLKKYPPIDYKLYYNTGEIKYVDAEKEKAW